MLSVTASASEAAHVLASQTNDPERAGVRITRVEGQPEARGELRLAVVDEPAEGDQQVPDAPVFLAPEVAELLDEMTLDADLSGEEIRFSVRED